MLVDKVAGNSRRGDACKVATSSGRGFRPTLDGMVSHCAQRLARADIPPIAMKWSKSAKPGREAVISSNFASGNATALNLAQTAQEYVDRSDN
ncbi:MAG: hypothetical protein EON93_06305 [Burkholderiales bacterium]|nr:MAG: hypothetical protein EON93_06305 [Burkholderiales bacterium]